MINIDFLVAGCNTRCRHCYVNGGPSPIMPIDDVLLCMKKLDETAKYLPEETSFTLDHEPMNHPQIEQIMYAAARTKHIVNYHHGMTTGLGLMRRKDKEAVIQSYLENGYQDFGITIHGTGSHHDTIVGRKGAFELAAAAAKFLAQMGCRVQISLMLNRYFAEDAGEISRLLEEVKSHDIYLAVPIFTPHSNMMSFEPYRATLETVHAIQGYLTCWRQNEQSFLETVHQNTISAAIERLHHMDLHQLWTEPQTELYLSLHHDCKLYAGNSGAETQCLGDLRTLLPEQTAAIISHLPGNRDYGAFYDGKDLPAKDDVCKALRALPDGLVYGGFESILYRAFTELGVPTRLLPKA